LASASASALLAPIFVSGKAASALDVETEARIRNAFDAVREGRITFVRPPAEADKLLVFKAGRIVESGPYDELVQHGGIFTVSAGSCKPG
jgi:ATP-binding cassette subfamily B protein